MGTDTTAATDRYWMELALQAARRAAELGEVPVGSVLVRAGQTLHALHSGQQLLACTHNQPIGLCDPTAHAEMLALRSAAQQLGNYRLDDCELYVTLEPCAMCAQAMLHARLKRVVFGAPEPKTGAAGSVLDVFALPQLNHHTQVQGGVMAEECGALLRDFFMQRRLASKRASTPLREDALRTPDQAVAAVWDAYPKWFKHSRFDQQLPALEGLRLHWLDLGAAHAEPPWLALHGPQTWWPELAAWAQQRELAGERVLLPDLLGFGQSDKPKKPHWHSLERHAQILWAWLDGQSVAQVRLAVAPGQQQLAQVVRAVHPQRVQELLLLSAPAGPQLPATWPDWPYTDPGYRAAHKAWQQAGWGEDKLA